MFQDLKVKTHRHTEKVWERKKETYIEMQGNNKILTY